jgi:hypothetical protein
VLEPLQKEIREIKDDKTLVIVQFNLYNVSEAVYMLTTNHYKRWVYCEEDGFILHEAQVY